MQKTGFRYSEAGFFIEFRGRNLRIITGKIECMTDYLHTGTGVVAGVLAEDRIDWTDAENFQRRHGLQKILEKAESQFFAFRRSESMDFSKA